MAERQAKSNLWQGSGLRGRLVGRVMAPEAWNLFEIGKGRVPAKVHSIPHSADLALISMHSIPTGLYTGGYRKSVWAFIGKLNSSMSDAPSPAPGGTGAQPQSRHLDTATEGIRPKSAEKEKETSR